MIYIRDLITYKSTKKDEESAKEDREKNVRKSFSQACIISLNDLHRRDSLSKSRPLYLTIFKS